jgi:hypothetical protein|tara:strand:- start:4918 stop:5613 length:696 start_codon:yes stop_codon:yes gene_type:complete
MKNHPVKNGLVKNGLVIGAMLLALASTTPAMTEEVNQVLVTSSDSNIAAHAEFDSEVAFILDEVIDELKAEWKDLDQEERQEVKNALRSLGEGININLADMGFSSVLIPIFAILFTFGSPVLIIALLLLFSYRKRKQRAALIEKFIDAGKDVPTELLATFNDNGVSGNNLQRGLMLSGIGTGLFLFLGILVDWDVASIALIPLCIGIARLLIWKLGEQPGETEARNTNASA